MLVVLCLISLAVGKRGSLVSGAIRSVVSVASHPFWLALDAAEESYDYAAGFVLDYHRHYRESQRLQTEFAEVTQRLSEYKELKAEHEAYKDLTRRVLRAPELEGDRNDIRVQRQRTMWEINIILAELDAIRLVEDFRKMVFDRRIQRLDEFLQSEARKYF